MRVKVIAQRIGIFFVSTVFLASYVSSTVGAISNGFDRTFFRGNNILNYDPRKLGGCLAEPSIADIGNKDYAGNNIMSAPELQAIAENQEIYQKAAGENNIPWELLAAIHFRESRLKRYGPTNGNGPYQITNTAYPAGNYTDEQFLDASQKAAAFVKSKSGGKDLEDPENVKYTLFAYNGMADSYITQAKNLGFTDAKAANGEGSPYVMNRADLARDPEASPSSTTWGQIKSDGGPIEYPANLDYGAFIVYAALAGIEAFGACNTGLVAGGMDLEKAKAFMESYKSDPEAPSLLGGAGRGGSGGPLANCVSFSVYFINKYTTLKGFMSGAPGNGINVATNVITRNPGVKSGAVPQPYAIFSTTGSSSAGHTGIVLGVNIEKNTFIVGEAGYNLPMSWITAREFSLSGKWVDGTTLYAYTDGFLKEGVN